LKDQEMAEILPSVSVPLSRLKATLKEVIHDPSLVMRAHLEHITELTQNKIEIVDPSTPFMSLVEMSCVNTSVAVDEHTLGFRRLYRQAATEYSDLYPHLSDKDYAGIFSNPAQCDFYVVIKLSDIEKRAYTYYVNTTDGNGNAVQYEHKDLLIPKGSSVALDNMMFSFEYSVIIRIIDNSELNILMDASSISPLQSLRTYVLDKEIRTDKEGVAWVYFKVPLMQLRQTIATEVIHPSSVFKKTIQTTERFHALRGFYKLNGAWTEFKVTYTGDIYDPFVPTLLVKIVQGGIEVTMPMVYSTMVGITGDIQLHMFTTLGAVDVNMASYPVADFILQIRDGYDTLTGTGSVSENAYKAALKASIMVMSTDRMSGGSNGMTFDELRYSTIYQTLGDRNIPITNVQVTNSAIVREGFEIISDVDMVTNRIFMAVKKLTTPKIQKSAPRNTPVLTAANLGIASVSFDNTASAYNFRTTGQRSTLMSNRIFLDTNGVIRLLDNPTTDPKMGNQVNEVNRIAHLNTGNYLFNPFYYVFDASGVEFEVRAYDLDNPSLGLLSIEATNPTNGTAVNTDSIVINKTSNGFKVTITTVSTSAYKGILEDDAQIDPDTEEVVYGGDGQPFSVGVHFALYSEIAGEWMFFRGTFDAVLSSGEAQYSCEFQTSYDVDTQNNICIKNAMLDNNGNTQEVYVPIDAKMRVFHLVRQNQSYWVVNILDDHGKEYLPDQSTLVPVTMEEISFTMGKYLKNLWTRSRSFRSNDMYERYTTDVPLLHDKNEYELGTDGLSFTIVDTGGVKNVVFNPIINAVGDVVMNDGEIVYKHRAGDIIYDTQGLPVLKSVFDLTRYVDILFVDAKYHYANTAVMVLYRQEITNTLTEWIMDSVQRLQDVLIEETNIYFYPKTSLSKVKVYLNDNKEDTIYAEQSLKIELYVNSGIYNDTKARQELVNRTAIVVDAYIGATSISVSDITEALKKVYGQSVRGIKFSGIGGMDKDYQVLYLKQGYNRLCLKKKLVRLPDGSLTVTEDIDVVFYNADRLLS